MSKKPRRRSPPSKHPANIESEMLYSKTQHMGIVTNIPHEGSPEMAEEETMPTTEPKQLPALADIRAEALRAQADAAHTIAELEAWRNEIDATIALLRSQRK